MIKKVVLFTKEECSPCLAFKNKIQNLNLNIDVEIITQSAETKQYFKKYRILSVPTTILLDENNEEVERIYGAREIASIYPQLEA